MEQLLNYIRENKLEIGRTEEPLIASFIGLEPEDKLKHLELVKALFESSDYRNSPKCKLNELLEPIVAEGVSNPSNLMVEEVMVLLNLPASQARTLSVLSMEMVKYIVELGLEIPHYPFLIRHYSPLHYTKSLHETGLDYLNKMCSFLNYQHLYRVSADEALFLNEVIYKLNLTYEMVEPHEGKNHSFNFSAKLLEKSLTGYEHLCQTARELNLTPPTPKSYPSSYERMWELSPLVTKDTLILLAPKLGKALAALLDEEDLDKELLNFLIDQFGILHHSLIGSAVYNASVSLVSCAAKKVKTISRANLNSEDTVQAKLMAYVSSRGQQFPEVLDILESIYKEPKQLVSLVEVLHSRIYM